MRKPSFHKEDNNRGGWSKHENQKLIQTHGEERWSCIPKATGLNRCEKSCRSLRRMNNLKPGIKRGNFAEDEEDLIIKLYALLGNRWSLIAGRLPGRTDNEVKNYWNSHLRKKLMKMGIDPNDHRLNQVVLPQRPPMSLNYVVMQCYDNRVDDQENNDGVSETGSSFEGESSR